MQLENNRDKWIHILASRVSHIASCITAPNSSFWNTIYSVRAREAQEQTRHHFIALGNLLELCKIKYTDIISRIQIKYFIQDGGIHIVPSAHIESISKEYQKLCECIAEIVVLLSPWRKGPFKIFDTFIDAEWVSEKKWKRLAQVYNIDLLCKNKIILDVGTNNGYYALRMCEHTPYLVLGIDPMPHYSFFYELYQLLMPSIPLYFEQMGIRDCHIFQSSFDTIFCMGVLYHQRNPLELLDTIRIALRKNGRVVIETICLNTKGAYCLFPNDRYLKSKGYWFIPTVDALKNMLYRSGFEVEAMSEAVKTEVSEQRRTPWIRGESLEDFLDPDSPDYTVEGYPAPYRVIAVARKRF